ncbi:spermatogenesis-associated protein 17-like [Dendronephthya gigantea]|uniref:spermatogenesis-associated protein 17-like n=1 Tax=Dendronephthya gigantea TaxID=151771 RepID=UPI0010692E69|nr:spermatogenesis-associated protein 17-like [Dendronephthya gigantea]
MATFIRLQLASSSIKDELFRKLREAERNRKTEYDSAVRIQSWFRGIKVRSYLRFLHHCATVIQRHYRGHLDRIWHQKIVQNAVVQMRERYYNSMATKIQKLWRGYHTRKYVHNYYSRKRYLEGLKTKNSIVRKELEVWRISLEREKEIKRQKEEEATSEAYNKRHHYLLSTAQIPGIYSARFNPELATKEVEIKSARRQDRVRKHKTFSGSTTARCANSESVLPPIGKAAQGPFRTQEEALHQRHRPLNPTLRVQTAYTSVEESRTKMKADEWIARVVEKPFRPFTHRERGYNPLLHTKSTFGSLPYGTKHFREEELDKHVSQEKFRTVVSPIPVFEQFGKTY